jgi:hypothetical protein
MSTLNKFTNKNGITVNQSYESESESESTENESGEIMEDIVVECNYRYPINMNYYPINDVNPKEYIETYQLHYNNLILKYLPIEYAPIIIAQSLQIPIYWDKNAKIQAERDFWNKNAKKIKKEFLE